MTSFSIQNFGCRVNQAEAFEWARELQKYGLKLEKDLFGSHLVLVNTCTLTSRADRDARRFIRKVTKQNPRAKVIVTGCLVERNYDEFRKMPEIWRIFDNREKKYLAERILSGIEPKYRTEIFPFRSRALLKVQDGCSLSCSFCVIPLVRGRSISRPKEEVLCQMKRLSEEGFKEIVLTGIHLCSYGQDLDPQSTLLDLLKDMEHIENLKKVRLSSLDPRLLPAPLLEQVTSSRKICPHFHLSLQHGSDRILMKMGRKSKVSDYQKILDCLHLRSPQASFGADIIVGFPGETDDDFVATSSFLEQSPLSYFHVFSYSPRPGTRASTWPQVEEMKKRKRAALLRELSRQKNIDFRRQFIGKELEAVVVKKENGQAQALTSNYIKILLASCAAEEGAEVRVKVIQTNDRETIGEVLNSRKYFQAGY